MLQVLDPEFADRPFETWDALRAQDPVSHVEGLGWIVTGYEQTRDLLRSPEFSSSPRFSSFHEPPEPGAELTPLQQFFDSSLFDAGPEDHVRLRRLVTRAFTPQGVKDQQEFTARLAGELLDRLTPGEELDLTAEVYSGIPALVIAHLIGLPPSLAGEFRNISDTLSLVIEPFHDEVTQRRIDEALVDGRAMFAELATQRRRDPADDLLTRLLEVEEDGDRLSFDELVAMLFGLVIAGAGTTANFLSMATTVLVDNPAEVARMSREPGRVRPVVEELLRTTCFGFGMPRFAIGEAQLGGHEVAAGEMLVAVIPAANVDPAAFPDPHRFDPDRENGHQLTFSIGAHHCLGAALARLEVNTVLGELTSRFGAIELVGEPEIESTLMFRNVTSLPVRLHAA